MGETDAFAAFRQEHPRYARAYERLEARDRILGLSALVVYLTQGGQRLGPVAEEILGFVERHFPAAYVDAYVDRVRSLHAMQAAFEESPSIATLADRSAIVAREDYVLTLLLSIVFANHRFEIMDQLEAFFAERANTARTGRIASVGIGSGYELKLMAEQLPGWTPEAYDIDPHAHRSSAQLLDHFGHTRRISFEHHFPLESIDEARLRTYDAIVLCELLEHLPDPRTALACAGEYLAPGGRIFATMAINIAQEDHVYLYPDVASCRAQIEAAGLRIVTDWCAPMAFQRISPDVDREAVLRRGNYIAVLDRP